MDSELVQRAERVAQALDVLAKNAAAAEVRGIVPPLYLSILKAASAMRKRAGVLHSIDGLLGSIRSGVGGVGEAIGALHGLVADPKDMLTNALRRAAEVGKRTNLDEKSAIEELLRSHKATKGYADRAAVAAGDRVTEEALRHYAPSFQSLTLPAAAAVAAGGVGYGLGRGHVQQDKGRSNLPVVYAS